MGAIAGFYNGPATEKIISGRRIGLWISCKSECNESAYRANELDCLKMGPHFLHIGFERIRHGKGCLATQLENRPVDHIRWREPLFRLGIVRCLRRSTGQ